MSNALAIAAVTATLKSVLQTRFNQDQQLTGTNVTILPLDKALNLCRRRLRHRWQLALVRAPEQKSRRLPSIQQ